MNFDIDLYQQVWQSINQEINVPQINIDSSVLLFAFDCIPSTNTKLWELIDRGAKSPLGAIALQQTAGKGQWGHLWVSKTGGLYLSVGLDLDLEIANYSHLVMATAWGLATVLRAYKLPVTIKWSNDLILDRRKLGGIKIEARNKKSKLVKAVVGVGINWRNSVSEPGINLKSYYRDKNVKTINSLEELTAIAAYGIILGYEYYLAVGIEKLLDEYLAIFNNLGQQVNFNGRSGEVIGVTIEGKLRVKLYEPSHQQSFEDSKEIAIAPGQISLGYR